MPKTWISKPVADWLGNHGHFADLSGYSRKKGRGQQSEIEVNPRVLASLGSGLQNKTIPENIRVQARMAHERIANALNADEGDGEEAA